MSDRFYTAGELVTHLIADISNLEAGIAKAKALIHGYVNEENRVGRGRGFSRMENELRGVAWALGMPALRSLTTGAIAGSLVFVTKQIGEAVTSFYNLGTEVERVSSAFRNMWGAEGTRALRAMREASQGMISDLKLMTMANYALFLGVADTTEELVGLMRVAQARGQAMGLSMEDSFQRIITGIGRLSPKILDDLGILTETTSTYAAYAAQIGKTARELTDAEKRQALVNRVLQDGARSLEINTSHVEKFTAAWEDLRNTVSVAIKDIVEESGALNAVADAIRDVADDIDEANRQRARMREIYGEEELTRQRQLYQAIAAPQPMGYGEGGTMPLLVPLSMKYRRQEEILEGARGFETILTDEAIKRAEAMKVFSSAFASMVYSMADPTKVESFDRALRLFQISSSGFAMTMEEYAAAAQQFSDKVKFEKIDLSPVDEFPERAEKFREALLAFVGAASDAVKPLLTARFFLKQQMSQYEVYTGAYGDLGYGVHYDRVKRRVEQLRYQNELAAQTRRDLAEAMERTQKTVSGAWDQAMESLASSIRSSIEKGFSLTQVTREDYLATITGVYREKPDEYIRRLRSSVMDPLSEWRHYLEGREGPAAELYLLEQERYFERGLWSRLGPHFDRQAAINAIVQGVLEDIQAQREREAIIQEIMLHPALQEISPAAIERALGELAPIEGMGLDAGQKFLSGWETTDIGREATDIFREQMEKQADRWIDAGVLAASWFAKGVESAVSTGLVGLLLEILVPRLEEALLGGRRP